MAFKCSFLEKRFLLWGFWIFSFYAQARGPCDVFLKMQDIYLGEDRKGVVYLSQKSQQEAFKVSLVDGELRYRKINRQNDLKYADGRKENGKLADGDYFFVRSTSGELFAARSELSAHFTNEENRLRHSSFLSSGDVMGAGHFVIKEGRITQINNRSGHYTPDGVNLFMNYLDLKEQGLPFSRDAAMTIFMNEEDLFFEVKLSQLEDLTRKKVTRMSSRDFHYELFQRSKKNQK